MHNPKGFAKLGFTCASHCESLDSQNPGKYASLSAASLDILSSRRMRNYKYGKNMGKENNWIVKLADTHNKKHTQHIAKALYYYTVK